MLAPSMIMVSKTTASHERPCLVNRRMSKSGQRVQSDVE